MRVWVTRDETAQGPLSTALRNAGLTPVLEPVVKRQVITDASDVIKTLTHRDWLVLTSPYAIESVARVPARVPQTAVIGESSARLARRRGFRVAITGGGGGATKLFAELRKIVTDGTVCYPRSALAAEPEPWGRVKVVSPVMYETVPRRFDRRAVRTADVVAVASPSAVTAIQMAAADDANFDQWIRSVAFASIGPTTSNALRKAALSPLVEPEQPSFDTFARQIAAFGDAADERPSD